MLPCYKCKGSKKYSPLGFVEVTCDKCGGIGFETYQKFPLLNDLQVISNESLDTVKRKKKKKKKLKKVKIHFDHPINQLRNELKANLLSNERENSDGIVLC